MREIPKLDELDMSKIESFKMQASAPDGTCSMGPGLTYPAGWEYCIGGIVFRCDGNGNWINQGTSCS